MIIAKLIDSVLKNFESAVDESVIKVCEKAMSGDLKSLEWLLEHVNSADKDKPDYFTGIPGNLLGSAFVDAYRDIRARRHRFYNFKGGRGSLKSSFCALVLIDEIMRNKNFCAIAFRQIKDTLKSSVYAQIKWAADILGLADLFEFTLAPLQIRKKDTGQIIYFWGCDAPDKIKSLRTPENMHIGVIWFEEKDQLKGSGAVRTILQTVMRGGDNIILSSYNTPVSRRHFLNQEELIPNKTALYHHSYYYNTPLEWLGQPFVDEAEYLKNINYKAYEHEYLGIATGDTGSIFENLEVREIARSESQIFERYYYGVDWGFFPDPWAFVKCAYDAKERVIYIIDESCEYKKSNGETADILKCGKGLTKHDLLICDSSEPKSIAEYNKLGLRAIGAEKGAVKGGLGGSVAYSMRWLQGLSKIIISETCAKSAREFQEYEYEKNGDGEVISSYPDKNNHLIDAVRYACTMLWRR